MPPPLEYLWLWFGEFAQGFLQTGMGIPTGGWLDLQAWEGAMDVSLDVWERRALIRLSTTRASVLSESKPTSKPPPQTNPNPATKRKA